MSYPKVGCYASLRSDGRPLLGHPDRIAGLAQWDDVVIELGCLKLYPQIIADLRAANPAIRLHAYVVMQSWASNVPFFRDVYEIVHTTNGVLLGSDGQPWPTSNVNVARPLTREALADLILAYADEDWAGIFIDSLVPQFHDQTDIGWEQMGYDSYHEWESAWNAGAVLFVERLKVSGKPVVTNYGNSFPGRSYGCMIESFPHDRGGTWEGNMIQNGSTPGMIPLQFAEPRHGWICSDYMGYYPHHPENQRRQRYHDASACLSGDFGSFGRYESDDHWCEVRHLFFAPHYRHPQRGKYWLGGPLGAPVHITEQKGKPVDLWRRFFEHGVAVVNPSSQPHSIYFSEQYRPIGGVAKDAWSIPAHDALIAEAV